MAEVPIPLYLPNILCYIRIILSFLSISTASRVNSSDNPFRLICTITSMWIVASFLDFIDGKVARYLNQCSKFGILLDIIADNVLRGGTWICVVIAVSAKETQNDVNCGTVSTISSNYNHGNESATFARMMTSSLPMLGLFLISIEWITMLASQMLTLLKEKKHWKDVGLENPKKVSTTTQPSPSPPIFIQAVFANNFRNFYGALAMYGLFSVGMIQFLYMHKCIILQSVPMMDIPLHVALVVSYIGRLLAFCTEMWLCYELVKQIFDEAKDEKIK